MRVSYNARLRRALIMMIIALVLTWAIVGYQSYKLALQKQQLSAMAQVISQQYAEINKLKR